MLRTIFVLTLVSIGTYYSLQGPFYALLFYIGNAYFRPEQWVWSSFIQSLDLSFFVGAYFVLVTILSGPRFIITGRIAILGLFFLHAFFSAVSSVHSTYALYAWNTLAKSMVITYFMVILTTDFSRLRLLLLTMAFSLSFEGAKQGWLHLVTSPTFPNQNPIPFLGDNNGVAVGMLMMVPVLALLRQTTHHKWERHLHLFLLVGVLFRAISTYSRGAFLACIAMGGVYWLHSQQKLRGLLAAGVIAVIVVASLPEGYWERMGTIQTYQEEEEGSALSRFHFWRVAVDMANANPVLGVGFLSYNLFYNQYDFLNGRYGKGRSVHSTYFGILAEMGYLGAFLYGLVLLGAFYSCIRVHRLAKRHPAFEDLGKVARALEASLIAFAVGGAFLPYQNTEIVWHYLGLTIIVELLAKQKHAELVRALRPSARPAPVTASTPGRLS
jgi:probable O-glycosylation ligase (exosortase A-associated)